MSYVNLTMYSAVLPTYDSDKDKGNKNEEIMNYMTIIIIIIFNIQIIAIFIRSVKRECISISQSIMHQTDNIEYFIS